MPFPPLRHWSNYQDDLRGRVGDTALASAAWSARWRLGSADGSLHLALDSGRAALAGRADRPARRFLSRSGQLRLRLVAGSWIRRSEPPPRAGFSANRWGFYFRRIFRPSTPRS